MKKYFVIKEKIITSLMKKNIIFYEKNSKLTKNITFNKVFCNGIFPHHRFLPIFKKWLDFHKKRIYLGKISSPKKEAMIYEN